MNNDYWRNYWISNEIVCSDFMQGQVGRTKNHILIDDMIWNKTLLFLSDELKFDNKSILLDLCAGNGVLTVPFSKICSKVTAVEISPILLKNMDEFAKKEQVVNLTCVLNNVLNQEFCNNSFTHIIMYFAIQHFSEKETLIIFERAYKWLKPDGIFYIGDIPNRNLLWKFVNSIEYEDMFFDFLKKDTPAIGTWFDPEYLIKMARYTGFTSAEVVCQPEWQINSHYRFDLKIIK